MGSFATLKLIFASRLAMNPAGMSPMDTWPRESMGTVAVAEMVAEAPNIAPGPLLMT